jgi:hypothetical protein
MKKILIILVQFLCCGLDAVPVDITETGSFGIINNTVASQAWLAPKNKQFSFYRVYPNCVKDQTTATCRQNVNWTNDLREYYYNGQYITFSLLDDARTPDQRLSSSANNITVTLEPLLEEQLTEDNLHIAAVCDKKAQTVTLTSYAVVTEGQQATSSWQISFSAILDRLYQLVVATKLLDTATLEATRNADMKLLNWYLNFTIQNRGDGKIVLTDISLDLVVLSNVKKEDAFTIFFSMSQNDITSASALRQLV